MSNHLDDIMVGAAAFHPKLIPKLVDALVVVLKATEEFAYTFLLHK